MDIFGIDPGLTIGYAWIRLNFTSDSSYNTFSVMNMGQTDKAQVVLSNYADMLAHGPSFTKGHIPYVIIEDFLSAGPLTKEGKQTIKYIGYFENTLANPWLKTPQSRLSAVPLATSIGEELKVAGPHSYDALAHCIVQARKEGVSRFQGGVETHKVNGSPSGWLTNY